MPRKSSMCIGQIYDTNSGGKLVIVGYANCEEVTVEFLNTGTVLTANAGAIRKGLVKDYMVPTASGVGYKGLGAYTTKTSPQAKRDWSHMLARCYTEGYHSNYKECTVCEEWHNFQNFAAWHHENYKGVGFALDKDIIKEGNTVYCPEFCEYVPQKLNNVLCNAKSIRGDMPVGVRLNHIMKTKPYGAVVYEDNKPQYLGQYSTVEEAFAVYKKEKELIIKRYAEHYYQLGQISSTLYHSLLKREIKEDIK